MTYSWDKANANAPSKRTTQYFEMFGNRAIYHEGWVAGTTPPAPPWLMGTGKMPDVVDGYKWELYNIADDYSESNDLAAKMPDKLRQMQERFLLEATKYNVFPLDNDVLGRVLTPKPSATAGRNVFTYSGEMSGFADSDSPNIVAKSYTITAEVEIPQGGAEGMLVTLGGRFGGYGFYLLKGKPVFLYNMLDIARFRWEGQQALSPGKHTIVFDFTYDGPGFAKGGTGVLKVDDKEVANQKIPHTVPLLFTLDETFDVGVDTRTPVNDNDYQVPFRFTGKLSKLTFKLGPTQLTSTRSASTPGKRDGQPRSRPLPQLARRAAPARSLTGGACAPLPIPQARCKVPVVTGGEKPKAILCASSEEICGRINPTKKPHSHE